MKREKRLVGEKLNKKQETQEDRNRPVNFFKKEYDYNYNKQHKHPFFPFLKFSKNQDKNIPAKVSFPFRTAWLRHQFSIQKRNFLPLKVL